MKLCCQRPHITAQQAASCLHAPPDRLRAAQEQTRPERRQRAGSTGDLSREELRAGGELAA